MQDYANVIRDTGPVPESNTTSVQNSDDESSITTGERSKFKISAASSKATSREVTPLRDNSPSPNKNTTLIGGGSNESKSEALKTVEGWSMSKSPTPPQPSSKNDLNVKENVDKKSEENKEFSSKTDSKIELETKDFTNNKKVSKSSRQRIESKDPKDLDEYAADKTAAFDTASNSSVASEELVAEKTLLKEQTSESPNTSPKDQQNGEIVPKEARLTSEVSK